MKNAFATIAIVSALAVTVAFKNMAPETNTELPVSSGDSTFAVSWETNNVAFGPDDKYVYLYTELKGGRVTADPTRKPLNIALVIDRSGSMQGNKMAYAMSAARTLVQNLHEGDHFALVDYDETISTPVFSTTIGANRQSILKEIDKLFARGSTNLCGGMLEGFTQAKTHYNKLHLNRVILLSDGLANVGITTNEEIQKMAKNKLDETGISLSSFGIGADFNEQLMTHLAEYGNGNYYFINNPDEITTQLAAELQGLMKTVAQNIKIKIKMPAEMLTVEKVYGGNYKVENGELIVDAGNVVAEETKPIMIKLRIKNMAAQAFNFKAVLQFMEGKDAKETTFEKEFAMHFVQDKKEVESTRNSIVWNAVQGYELNEIMEHAMVEMERGNQAGAKVLLDTVHSSKFKGYVSDTLHFMTNTTVIKQYNLQHTNNATYHTKSAYEQKVLLKQGRADAYQVRSKSIKK
jgi:Ca-activated chloride channel family protein